MPNENQLREALRLLQEIHPVLMTPTAETNWRKAVEILQALAAMEAKNAPPKA